MTTGTSATAKTSVVTLGVIQTLLGLCLVINSISLPFVPPALIVGGIVTTILGIVLHKCSLIPYVFGLLTLIGIGHILLGACLLTFIPCILSLALALIAIGILLLLIALVLLIKCKCKDNYNN